MAKPGDLYNAMKSGSTATSHHLVKAHHHLMKAHAHLSAHSIKTTGKFHGKSNKLGGGGRFAQVEAKAKAGGARNPAAVAAAVGRKKYGAKKFAKMAAQGRKRA